MALEYPGIWGGMVDLAHKETENDAQTLLGEIWNPEGEDHVAFRNEGRYVLRLVPANLPDPRPSGLQADATYMITGGLGSLGLRVAGWMVQQGARHLVLTGRREASIQSQESLDRLRQKGAQVTVVRADVSDEEAMNQVFAEINTAGPPLRGIVHAAGVLGSSLSGTWTIRRSSPFCVPRWSELRTASTHSQPESDFFACFSSIASVWGSMTAHYTRRTTSWMYWPIIVEA